MSSDGQSIPFGRNWIHEVERGLDRAKLMFVFLTPNSVRSSWLYFEAGHAYSKGIRVVPVAMLGTDLATVSPPLSLIQGFNINSEGGLGNIVAIANQEFGHRHNESFSHDDLSRIVTASGLNSLSGIGSHAVDVEEIVSDFSESTLAKESIAESLQDASEKLSESSIDCAANGLTLEMMGVVITGVCDKNNPKFSRIEIKIDPITALQGLEALKVVKLAVCKNHDDANYIQVSFSDGITMAEGFHRLSGRLTGTDVKIAGSAEYSFRSITFSLDKRLKYTQKSITAGNPFLKVKAESEGSELCRDLRELLDLLFDRRVLWRSG